MFNNKRAILLFLFLTSIAFILSIFRTSEFSSEYKDNKAYHFQIQILERLERLFHLVKKEKNKSILYLAEQNEINFNKIDKARYETKLYIKALLIYIDRKNEFKILKKSLENIVFDLNQIYRQVDNGSKDYPQSILSNYHNQIIKKVTYNMRQVIENLPLEYSRDLEKWLDYSSINNRDVSLLLLVKIERSLADRNNELEKEIFIYVLISTLFLFVTLFLLYWSKAITRHKIELVATLKEIEEDLSDKQRLEIQEVLKKDDTLEVYKFLARTIKEPNMAKDQFLANMSHEVRTPLNGIMGFTTLLQGTEVSEEQAEFLEIIKNSSESLLTIVNDILDFSKVSSGHFELEKISFNIIERIETTIESYSENISKKNIELGLYLDPNLPLQLLGDPTRISQVILNLLGNAVKFTAESKKINISITLVSKCDTEVEVKFLVEDTGIGIAKNKQNHIFDAFSQADLSTNRKFGGTGLGLTISRKFVELMGGKLELESEKGVGSTFYFNLILKIDKEYQSRVSPNFSKLKVGCLIQNKNDYKEVDENIKSYVTYTKAQYKTYDENQLLNLSGDLLPDILFVNHRYVKNEKNLNYLLTLPTKLVLISSSKMNEFTKINTANIYKLIYKPMNFTKMMKILDKEYNPPLNNILLYKSSKLSGKIYSSILESLGYEVDIYYSIYEFKKQVESKKYKLALFDDKNTNNQIMAKIIKDNGAIPFLFSEEKDNDTCCQILDYSIDANTLEEELKRA